MKSILQMYTHYLAIIWIYIFYSFDSVTFFKKQNEYFKLLVSVGIVHMCFQTAEKVKKVLILFFLPLHYVTFLAYSITSKVSKKDPVVQPSTHIHAVCSNDTFHFLKEKKGGACHFLRCKWVCWMAANCTYYTV